MSLGGSDGLAPGKSGVGFEPRAALEQPDSAEIAPSGSLSIGGIDVHDLVDQFGTPLFVYDEDHLRSRAKEAVAAFPAGVAYATKAFICGAMVRLALEEGMDLDVSTGGEIQVAVAAGAPADRLVFHGNNKSRRELAMALELGVKRIVVDSFVEMDKIESLVTAGATPPGMPGPRTLMAAEEIWQVIEVHGPV